MQNIAYTDEYLTYRAEQAAIFCDDYLQSEKLVTLDAKYQIKTYFYRGFEGPYSRHATENELLDEAGNMLYGYRTLDDDGAFQKIIHHRNGTDYLLFRSDLYGYSVLNLSTRKEFHYIPFDAETFIWTDVFYNADNDVLAVSGCYWACPFGTLLQDFSNPMQEPFIWADVQGHLEDGYDRFDDVNFVQWSGTDLILCAANVETGKKESISLCEKEYGAWLRHEELRI